MVSVDTSNAQISLIAHTHCNPDFLTSLFKHEWTLTKSPAGAHQFEALQGAQEYPEPFDNKTFRRPTMLVSDLALREDPIYGAIARAWVDDFQAFTHAFAAAWCKSRPSLPCDLIPLTRLQ
jgi:catalase-peroxidase